MMINSRKAFRNSQSVTSLEEIVDEERAGLRRDRTGPVDTQKWMTSERE
jgi:hypothetical protein